MICTIKDEYIKNLIRKLEMLWVITLNDGTIVYSDYNRPLLDNPWIRLIDHCSKNNVYPVKIQSLMFGAPNTVLFEDSNGLDGLFVLRGSSQDVAVGIESGDEPGQSYKQLVVGLLRDNEDFIDVKKFCWPENELEKLTETRFLTFENLRYMFFKNESKKRNRESVRIALDGATV